MSLKIAGPVIGIDFGTTGFRIAALVDQKAKMITGEDGRSTVPADVLLRTDGSSVVGSSARRHDARDGDVVVHAVKRILGRSWADPVVAGLRSEFGNSMIETEAGVPAFVVGEARWSPEQVCRLMFENIREMATSALKQDVTHAVLAVPADYGVIQRKALAKIAAEAGLTTVRILSEPTAAALYSAAGAENRTFAIFDIGGGTFDISIVDVGDGVYEVLASDGDPLLGGEDIDLRLLSHVLGQTGLTPEDLAPDSFRRLRTAVEDLKRRLSSASEASLSVEDIEKLDGTRIAISQSVQRDTLQDMCQDLIDRTLVICNRALAQVDGETYGPMAVDQVDEVVLIGGTTHLPFVQECVTRFFGKPPRSHDRREDAVALGCALQAGILAGEQNWPLLLDVTAKSYGFVVAGEPAVAMIQRNSSFPATKEAEFTSSTGGGGKLHVSVFEGDVENASTNPVVGSLVIDPVRDADGRAQLLVTLFVTADGYIEIEILDVRSSARTRRRLHADPTVASVIATVDAASRPAPLGDVSPARRHRRRKVLAVATEWSSGAGGLSTFNREFCLALSAAGHDVRCLVRSADIPERQSAEAGSVMLIEAVRAPGQSEATMLSRKPRMPDEWSPDLVIGHGRITGPDAASLVADHYPQADRMHLFHMAPDEIEWLKDHREDDAGERAEDRTNIERQLGEDARYAVAVGPRLYNRYLRDFAGRDRLPLRLDPGFDSRGTTPIGPPPGSPHSILLVGRAEDQTLKGLDIAAKALGTVFRRWRGTEFELVVRGAPHGESEPLRNSLRTLAKASALKILVRPYTIDAEDLAGDYRRSSLVLMPSRSEGFGLVGLEAICAGVPVLVTSQSGLAGLLGERLEPEDLHRTVVPVTDDLKADATAWANAIERVLHDRDAAFAHAMRLQATLSGSANWATAITTLLNQMNEGG